MRWYLTARLAVAAIAGPGVAGHSGFECACLFKLSDFIHYFVPAVKPVAAPVMAPLPGPVDAAGHPMVPEVRINAADFAGVAVTQDKDYYVSSKISQCGHMELVIIVSTITAFFSHFLIEKGIVANSVSVMVATLMTWLLVRMQADNLAAVSITDISIAALTALVISLIIGVVFAQHKKCSK